MTSSTTGIHNKNDDDFEATSTYVAVDVTTNDTSTTTTTTPHPVVNNEWFRSQCPDIPDEARGWTWDDSFYSNTNNEDIVAAFDIDRTIHDRPTMEIVKWVFWIPPFFILAVTLAVLFLDGWKSGLFLFTALLAFFGVSFYLPIYELAELKRRISCLHIAVGTRGIYIDLVDSPGSLNLIDRTIITYDKIRKCEVVYVYKRSHGTMKQRIYIHTKDDFDCNGWCPYNIVVLMSGPRCDMKGIKNPQKFVDIVNAMMERHTGVAQWHNSNEQQVFIV